MDQWTMRQSSLELQLMIKQSTNNASSFFPVNLVWFLNKCYECLVKKTSLNSFYLLCDRSCTHFWRT